MITLKDHGRLKCAVEYPRRAWENLSGDLSDESANESLQEHHDVHTQHDHCTSLG